MALFEAPVLAIVGRTNVGKSTLFNCLTKTRSALVADWPGLTRDRLYSQGQVGSRPYFVVDTGGLGEPKDKMTGLITQQTYRAIQEANQLLLVMDARSGITPVDQAIVASLRTFNKPIALVLNKAEGLDANVVKNDFCQFGLGAAYVISAAHGQGIEDLVEALLIPSNRSGNAQTILSTSEDIKVAIVGRPNVGKSTLVNRMLGEERVLVLDQPGTTRDSVLVPFYYRDQAYCLIDTAGIRRRTKIETAIERFSLLKSLQSIAASHVAILVLDAQAAATEQDLHLLGFVLDSGKALIIVVNKWDSASVEQRRHVRNNLDRHLGFAQFVPVRFISALTGSGVRDLLPLLKQVYTHANRALSTAELTRLLARAVAAHPPSLVQGHPIKLRYAHPGGYNPPIIVIHGKRVQCLPHSYQRYLENFYRKALASMGTPIQIKLRNSTH